MIAVLLYYYTHTHSFFFTSYETEGEAKIAKPWISCPPQLQIQPPPSSSLAASLAQLSWQGVG
jgi:hypothetical protein